ncbi:hypothetical protein [Vreelandella glaciei]|uniref:hypothetical protein n=1 Tax=Vreelandella glaciei TaxID=186761 RepID=UPI0030011394
MLFPLHSQTPLCSVFILLNNEFLHFLQKSIHRRVFSEALFTQHPSPNGNFPSVCWTNTDTRKKFHSLWKVLPDEEDERRNLFESISQCQSIETFFDDTEAVLIKLEPEELFSAVKALTTHLFLRTKSLSEAKQQSDSSIEKHYQDFLRTNNNSTLCYVCGTECLSQNRANLADEDQWRADYDHILCKDKYSIYGAHPGNFIPTCHTCNSKAKGARNLLVNKEGLRRKAFYPLPPSQESCHAYATIEIQPKTLGRLTINPIDTPLEEVVVNFPNAPAELLDKVSVWREVYQVPTRVENRVAVSFCEAIFSRLLEPIDFNDFCAQLKRFASRMPRDYRTSEWSFWWYRVCEHLAAQDAEFLRDIWTMLNWKLQQADEGDMEATFGRI